MSDFKTKIKNYLNTSELMFVGSFDSHFRRFFESSLFNVNFLDSSDFSKPETLMNEYEFRELFEEFIDNLEFSGSFNENLRILINNIPIQLETKNIILKEIK